MFSLFIFSFLSVHNIFSLKYWTLSLKLESLMNHEEKISSRQMVLTSALFWTLEGLLVTSAIINVVDSYTKFDEIYPFGLQVTGFTFSTTVSLISIGVIIDAFRRLSKCLEQDSLGISRK